MFQRLLYSAVGAGIAAGLIAALLHFAFVQKLILLGEEYETGALTHFGTFGTDGHDHAALDAAPAEGGQAAAADGHDHDHAAPGDDAGGPLGRNGLTVVFYAALYVAYAFLLTAGFALAEAFGRRIGPQEGLLWGIAGFVSLQFAPAMGLAPELPGTLAADLALRQIWWWATVGCTALGLGLLAYGRHWAAFALAGAFLALPHVIGAPVVEGFYGAAPPEVGSAFATRVLGVALVTWAVLGWLAASAWARLGDRGA